MSKFAHKKSYAKIQSIDHNNRLPYVHFLLTEHRQTARQGAAEDFLIRASQGDLPECPGVQEVAPPVHGHAPLGLGVSTP